MGRGRQKAKHTKLARELKAYSPEVDYNALERELAANQHADDAYGDWVGSSSEDAEEYESQGRQKRA